MNRLAVLLLLIGLSFLMTACLGHRKDMSTFGTLEGRITDSVTGEGVIGAAIMLVGTTRGAYTDESGSYRIVRIPPEAYSIVFSSLDHETVQVPVLRIEAGQSTRLEIRMVKKPLKPAVEVKIRE